MKTRLGEKAGIELLASAKFIPLTYGMEILKGAVVYGHSFHELLYPISVLVFMGVVFMGIGINLMERKAS